MSSPFSIFRKHQRILMVIVTGLAMVSFVLFGAVSDPRDMPPQLIIIALACMVGGIGWMLGLTTGKASEWGITGLIAGAACGLVMNVMNREPDAVQMDGGNLSQQAFAQVRRERELANFLVRQAFFSGGDRQFEAQFQLPAYMFGVTSKDESSEQEIVIDEMLRREADKLGITISDDTIREFINTVSGGKLTQSMFKEIRSQANAGEQELLTAVRNEMKAREAFKLLYPKVHQFAYMDYSRLGSEFPVPPESYWEFYKKLNVRQSAEVVEIPLAEFVDKASKPSESERQELFAKYSENFPNFTPEGRLEEGRPGFFQPRRVQLAYLEAVFEDIKPTVGEVPDAEIQKLYEERYLRAVPSTGTTPGLEGLQLPELPLRDPPVTLPPVTPPATPTTETAPAAPAETPATNPPVEAPATPAQPATEPATESPPAESPATEPATPESPAAEPAAPPADSPAPGTSSAILRTTLIPVAFLDDAPPAVETPAPATGETPPATETPAPATTDSPPPAAPATETPATETPATETPATETPAAEVPAETAPPSPPMPEAPAADPDSPAPAEGTPAEGTPAEGTPAEGTPAETPPAIAPAEGAPAANPADIIPPPPTGPRALDDELKNELREEILRRRTDEEITKRITAANEYMFELSSKLGLGENEEGHLKKEQLAPALKKYAQEHGLEYVETKLLSFQELQDSEDFPVGKAIDSTVRSFVANKVFSTRQDMHQPSIAKSFESSSGFSYWKIDEKDDYAPKTLDDPVVIEQVDTAWRLQQAAVKAHARADELVKMLSGNTAPAAEVLGEATVTGKPESIFLTVKETGEFTWMRRPAVPSTNMSSVREVERTDVPGAPKGGQRFMETVFEKLKPGEAGVAESFDGSVLYVVRIKERHPATDEEFEAMRKQFIAGGVQPAYATLAGQTISEYSENWIDELMEKYNVQMSGQVSVEE